MTAQQVQEFWIEDMARDMQRLEPELWDLVVFLLSGENSSSCADTNLAGADMMDEDKYFAALGDDAVPMDIGGESEETAENQRVRLLKGRRRTLQGIVSPYATI